LRILQRKVVVNSNQFTDDPIAGSEKGLGIDLVRFNITTYVTDPTLSTQGIQEYEGSWNDDA